MSSTVRCAIILSSLILLTASGVFAQAAAVTPQAATASTAAQPAAVAPAAKAPAAVKPVVAAAKPAVAVKPITTPVVGAVKPAVAAVKKEAVVLTPTVVVLEPTPTVTAISTVIGADVMPGATPEANLVATMTESGGSGSGFGVGKLWIKLGGGGGMMMQSKLEDAVDAYKVIAIDNGYGLESEVSRASFSGVFEMGYAVNPKWGFSFSGEMAIPGKFKAALNNGPMTLTQEISQVVVPATLNVYTYILPKDKSRFYVSAGGGALASFLTHKVGMDGIEWTTKMSGIGPCVRMGFGHQWLLNGRNVLDIGVRGLWGSISRFTGTILDENGTTYEAAMVETTDGLIEPVPSDVAGTGDTRYLKLGYMGLDAQLSVSLYF